MTDNEVREIRFYAEALRKGAPDSRGRFNIYQQIADRYGISRSAALEIVKGNSYQYVK